MARRKADGAAAADGLLVIGIGLAHLGYALRMVGGRWVEVELEGVSLIALGYIVHLETADLMADIVGKRKGIEQILNIAYAVDMTVGVDIRVVCGAFHQRRCGISAKATRTLYGVGERSGGILADAMLKEMVEQLGLTCQAVDHGPDG